jgi:hypothetical protein
VEEHAYLSTYKFISRVCEMGFRSRRTLRVGRP